MTAENRLSTDTALEKLKQDVARWNAELERLKSEGKDSLIPPIERWIRDAQRLLRLWN
jgi:anti-sigma-K factor RskA